MNEDKIDVEQIEPTADFTDELSDEALDRATAGVLATVVPQLNVGGYAF